jgi:hypothetical protein
MLVSRVPIKAPRHTVNNSQRLREGELPEFRTPAAFRPSGSVTGRTPSYKKFLFLSSLRFCGEVMIHHGGIESTEVHREKENFCVFLRVLHASVVYLSLSSPKEMEDTNADQESGRVPGV